MCEPVKREYLEKLGYDFGTVLYEIRNDWLTGLVRLKEYRVLFSDRDAVKLLNAAGGGFMWDVQQILWHDLLLHVTRLTDPASMGGHQNLSVRALPRFCKAPGLQAEYPDLRAEVQTLVDKAVNGSRRPTRLAQSADQPYGSWSGHRPRRAIARPNIPGASTGGARRRARCDPNNRRPSCEARHGQ